MIDRSNFGPSEVNCPLKPGLSSALVWLLVSVNTRLGGRLRLYRLFCWCTVAGRGEAPFILWFCTKWRNNRASYTSNSELEYSRSLRWVRHQCRMRHNNPNSWTNNGRHRPDWAFKNSFNATQHNTHYIMMITLVFHVNNYYLLSLNLHSTSSHNPCRIYTVFHL